MGKTQQRESRTPQQEEIIICGFCDEEVDWNSYRVEEWKDQGVTHSTYYCHNPDWIIYGGTCWEQRVIEDLPECEEWLYYGFECDGCIPDEWGECTCTSDSWE